MTGRTDEAMRTIGAHPSALYHSFEHPSAMESWLRPAGMTCRMERLDFRQGGSCRMRLTPGAADPGPGKSSEDTDAVEVRFVRLVEDRLIVQAVSIDSDDPRYSGVMWVTWTFRPVPSGTEVSVRCENVPEGIGKDEHLEGLESTLANLARLAEGTR